MTDRSKNSRRGWGELVSELVNFARKAGDMAQAWKGERAVDELSAKIRTIAGFGGKGCCAIVACMLSMSASLRCVFFATHTALRGSG